MISNKQQNSINGQNTLLNTNEEFFDAISTNSFKNEFNDINDLNEISIDTNIYQSQPSFSLPPSSITTTNFTKTVLKYSEKNPGIIDLNLEKNNPTELHYLVFNNDLDKLNKTIQRYKKNLRNNVEQLGDKISIQDKHGNTPLHIAAMLGHIDAAKILIDSGAIVKSRNKQMWTPLNEAVSYGNRDLIKCILKKYEQEVDRIINDSKPKINSALKEMVDFYVEIKWDFESWIPLVSRFLPSDVCKLYKSSTKIRVDCTLEDIARNSAASGTSSKSSSSEIKSSSSPFNWQRGNLTFIFDLDKIGTKNSILFIDHNKKTFTYVDKQQSGQFTDNEDNDIQIEEVIDIEKEVDILMSREMIFIKLDTELANFIPTQVGWFSKRDKLEMVNGYSSQFYDVNNLYIISKLRTEHISEEELKRKEEKQKKFKENLTKSKSKQKSISSNLNDIDLDDNDMLEEIEYRPNLAPPPKIYVSWEEYLDCNEGEWPNLGRKLRMKESKKEFKAQLAMSQEFPLTIQDLNKLLDALAPLAKFRKLKDFISLKLPPGFPVKIDIPIVPTITAKVSFQNFKKEYEFTEELFRIPDNYQEDSLEALLKKSKTESNLSSTYSHNDQNVVD